MTRHLALHSLALFSALHPANPSAPHLRGGLLTRWAGLALGPDLRLRNAVRPAAPVRNRLVPLTPLAA